VPWADPNSGVVEATKYRRGIDIGVITSSRLVSPTVAVAARKKCKRAACPLIDLMICVSLDCFRCWISWPRLCLPSPEPAPRLGLEASSRDKKTTDEARAPAGISVLGWHTGKRANYDGFNCTARVSGNRAPLANTKITI